MNIYLDHNATTPVDPRVLDAMLPYFTASFGNPSSVHADGQKARAAVDNARQQVATTVGAKPEEIIFTSGGTEASNLALFGQMARLRKRSKKMAISALEHPAVKSTAQVIAQNGVDVVSLSANKEGVVARASLEAALVEESVGLVSIMLANNDTGIVLPVKNYVTEVKKYGALFHCDAVQALGKIPIDVRDLDVDMMSFASHKVYGPKGVGALYVKEGTRLSPHIVGASQEWRLRAGTENVPGIVGFASACQLASEHLALEAKQISQLRDAFEQGVKNQISDVFIHGETAQRLPGTSSMSIKGVEGETMVMALDMAGISASSGAACSSESREPSEVLTAMGISRSLAMGTLRFSFGRHNTLEQATTAVRALSEIVTNLREMG